MPGNIQVYGYDAVGIVNLFASQINQKHIIFERLVMGTSPLKTTLWSGWQVLDNNVHRILFGEEYAPILVDPNTNTITLDPDWVAPTQGVKSVNNILPDENGNVELLYASDAEIFALMLEENALPVIQDEDGAVLASAENEILFI